MTQQQISSDLAFQLAGEGVQITYLTSGQDGQPHFSYKDAEYDLNFAGDQILYEQNALGTLATIKLRIMPDIEVATVTLIVPAIALNDPSKVVEMLAVKCVKTMILGASPSYEAILLKGTVQSSIPQ